MRVQTFNRGVYQITIILLFNNPTHVAYNNIGTNNKRVCPHHTD